MNTLQKSIMTVICVGIVIGVYEYMHQSSLASFHEPQQHTDTVVTETSIYNVTERSAQELPQSLNKEEMAAWQAQMSERLGSKNVPDRYVQAFPMLKDVQDEAIYTPINSEIELINHSLIRNVIGHIGNKQMERETFPLHVEGALVTTDAQLYVLASTKEEQDVHPSGQLSKEPTGGLPYSISHAGGFLGRGSFDEVITKDNSMFLFYGDYMPHKTVRVIDQFNPFIKDATLSINGNDMPITLPKSLGVTYAIDHTVRLSEFHELTFDQVIQYPTYAAWTLTFDSEVKGDALVQLDGVLKVARPYGAQEIPFHSTSSIARFDDRIVVFTEPLDLEEQTHSLSFSHSMVAVQHGHQVSIPLDEANNGKERLNYLGHTFIQKNFTVDNGSYHVAFEVRDDFHQRPSLPKYVFDQATINKGQPHATNDAETEVVQGWSIYENKGKEGIQDARNAERLDIDMTFLGPQDPGPSFYLHIPHFIVLYDDTLVENENMALTRTEQYYEGH
ncbi:hypothetical protein [Caldalkalibacillus salinus]|uniref:hypothetical protein n=1 Tax=Caldalkalibacillus salinus TaxID=2803787 RepID=UPI0019247241|nr:hypothetical protein [Caldalkalibacillus salinus]